MSLSTISNLLNANYILSAPQHTIWRGIIKKKEQKKSSEFFCSLPKNCTETRAPFWTDVLIKSWIHRTGEDAQSAVTVIQHARAAVVANVLSLAWMNTSLDK